MKCVVGAYSQIPAGADDDEYKALTENLLVPLLKTVYESNSFKLVLYLGIHIFEWMEQNHAEINMLIKNLCKLNKLELLTGTYYDSFPGLIPSYEISLQIEKSTTYLRKMFSKKPHGIWLNYQVFNPSIVPILDKCALDYVVISNNSHSDLKIPEDPFKMDELGRKAIIFPLNNDFSQIVKEASVHNNSEKFYSDVKNLLSNLSSSKFNLLFFNLDYLCNCNYSSFIFPYIYDNTNSSFLLSEILEENDRLPFSYLPSGIYGNDVKSIKEYSLNARIINTPVISKHYQELNFIRDSLRSVKKNTDERKHLENLIHKASSSLIYLPEFYNYTTVQNLAHKNICEAEECLFNLELLPEFLQFDQLDGREMPVYNKNYMAHINERSGHISSYFLLNNHLDFCYNTGSGIFFDIFNSLIYQIENIDRKKADYLLISEFHNNHTNIKIEKHYKFRQNYIFLTLKITNNSNKIYKNIYSISLDLSFPKEPSFQEFQENVQSLSLIDKKNPVIFNLNSTDNYNIYTKNVVRDYSSIIGIKHFYQYTHIELKKDMTINPDEIYECSFTLRLDKKKTGETIYDTK